jgi:ketopantoate reductase
VIVATKVMDIEDAVRAAAPMIGPDSLVLAIQNGLQTVVSADNFLEKKKNTLSPIPV